MEIYFYATLRQIVGDLSIQLDLPNDTSAKQLIHLVVEKYPSIRNEMLDENNHFHDHMKMFINGREVIYLEEKFDHIIQASDKIDFFPPTGGG